MKIPDVFHFQRKKKSIFLTFQNLICYISLKISLSQKVLASLLIMKWPRNTKEPFLSQQSTLQKTDIKVTCVYMYKKRRIL